MWKIRAQVGKKCERAVDLMIRGQSEQKLELKHLLIAINNPYVDQNKMPAITTSRDRC